MNFADKRPHFEVFYLISREFYDYSYSIVIRILFDFSSFYIIAGGIFGFSTDFFRFPWLLHTASRFTG